MRRLLLHASITILFLGCTPAEAPSPPPTASAMVVDAGQSSVDVTPVAVVDAGSGTCARGVPPSEYRKPQPMDEALLAGLTRIANDADASVSTRERADYDRGALYHQANRFDEAIAILGPIALGSANPDLGEAAVERYLDALNASGRPCFAQFERDALLLRDRFCAGPLKKSTLCTKLRFIVVQVRIGRAQVLAETDRAAAAAMFEEMFKESCVGGADSRMECDVIGYNAAIAWDTSGDHAKARAMLAVMKNPTNGLARNPLTERLDCVLTGKDAGACH